MSEPPIFLKVLKENTVQSLYFQGLFCCLKDIIVTSILLPTFYLIEVFSHTVGKKKSFPQVRIYLRFTSDYRTLFVSS